MVLKNEWGKNEIREEIKNFLETNENELRTTQNLWDTAKAVLRGKFIATQAYLKKIETVQTNNQSYPYKTGGTRTKTAQRKQKEGKNQDQSRVK